MGKWESKKVRLVSKMVKWVNSLDLLVNIPKMENWGNILEMLVNMTDLLVTLRVNLA